MQSKVSARRGIWTYASSQSPETPSHRKDLHWVSLILTTQHQSDLSNPAFWQRGCINAGKAFPTFNLKPPNKHLIFGAGRWFGWWSRKPVQSLNLMYKMNRAPPSECNVIAGSKRLPDSLRLGQTKSLENIIRDRNWLNDQQLLLLTSQYRTFWPESSSHGNYSHTNLQFFNRKAEVWVILGWNEQQQKSLRTWGRAVWASCCVHVLFWCWSYTLMCKHCTLWLCRPACLTAANHLLPFFTSLCRHSVLNAAYMAK